MDGYIWAKGYIALKIGPFLENITVDYIVCAKNSIKLEKVGELVGGICDFSLAADLLVNAQPCFSSSQENLLTLARY